MKKIDVIRVAGFSLASSILFYFLSNTNTFLVDSFNMYPNIIHGVYQLYDSGYSVH